jgi:DNA transformation protein and related proteins
MPVASEFAAHCQELLGAAGPVSLRRMFGGHGYYVDGLFVALSFRDTLYLKTDTTTRGLFEAAGAHPFDYPTQDGQRTVTGYWAAPQDAMESPALMLPWVRLAIASALRAASSRRPAAPRRTAATPRQPVAKKSARGRAG